MMLFIYGFDEIKVQTRKKVLRKRGFLNKNATLRDQKDHC